MDALLKMAADAGMTKEQGEAATGGIFALAKKHLESGQYNQILDKIPGIEGVVQKHEESTKAAPAGGGGGLASSLTALAGSSGAGGITGLLATLSKQGITPKEMNAFMPQIVSFVKQQSGVDIGSMLGVSGSAPAAGAPAAEGSTATTTSDSASSAVNSALGSAMGMFGKK